MSVECPRLRFEEVGGVRTARLADASAISYDRMADDLVAIYQSDTIGQLRTTLTTAIVEVVGAGRGFQHRGNNTYIPDGTLFHARLELNDTTARLKILKARGIEMKFETETGNFCCETKNGTSANRLTETHYTYDFMEQRLALYVIDSLATAVHEQNPGYNVDEQIFDRMPELLSELAFVGNA